MNNSGEVFIIEYTTIGGYHRCGIYSRYADANRVLIDYLIEKASRNRDFGYYPIIGEDGWYVYSKSNIHNRRLDRIKPHDWNTLANGRYNIVKVELDQWEE